MIGPKLDFTPRGLYIGGEWQEAAGGGRLASINPSTGEPLGEAPAATAADSVLGPYGGVHRRPSSIPRDPPSGVCR